MESHSTENKQDQQRPQLLNKATSNSDLDQPARSRLPINVKLLLGGIAFFCFSSLVTRRALHRRRLASIPPFYTSSVYHQPRVNGAIEAIEALNIATINVVSVSMVFVGGALCALNVNSLDDMRRLIRGGTGADGTGRTETDLEAELEEWIAGVLDRKERRKKGESLTNERGKGQ